MKYSSQEDDWKTWKRQLWNAAYMGDSSNGVSTPVTVTHFARCLLYMELSLRYSIQTSGWKSDLRSKWLREVNALISPAEDVLFGLDLVDQISECINNNSVEQWGDNVDRACSKLYDCATTLDKVAKDTGIARTTGGGAAIAGGVLAAIGVIAAPFTAGASLAATAGGTALATAGGLTSFTASMVKYGWDKNKTKEGEEITKEVCKHAHILIECLTLYREIMSNFKEFLDTPEGEQLIGELKAAKFMGSTFKQIAIINLKSDSKLITLGLAGKKMVDVARVAKVVSVLRPDAAAKLLAAEVAAGGLPRLSLRGVTLFSGVAAGSLAAKALAGVGSIVGVGFGIWDVVGGANQIKNGNEIASQYRKFANDLKMTKKTVIENFDMLMD